MARRGRPNGGDSLGMTAAPLPRFVKNHVVDGPGAPVHGPLVHVPSVLLATGAIMSAWTFRDTLVCGHECKAPLMCVLRPGRFRMGSPADEPGRQAGEEPRHTVIVAARFAIGAYPVTFDEYDGFAEVADYRKSDDEGWGRGRRPVIHVSWDEAQDYCVWLSEQTGHTYRLPSEAEWEFACRAGTETPFHTGTLLDSEAANFDGRDLDVPSDTGCFRGQTLPVGSFPPNRFGLYDRHGNTWEWCQDAWQASYEGAPSDTSAWQAHSLLSQIFGSTTLGARVLRGGSWADPMTYCRSAARNFEDPGMRSASIGFRVCRAVEHAQSGD